MEYKLKSAALQDLQTKTVRLTAKAGDLGTISSGNLVIPAADLNSALVAADFLVANNLSAAEPCTVTLGSGNFTLDSTTAITASSLIDIVIKLP